MIGAPGRHFVNHDQWSRETESVIWTSWRNDGGRSFVAGG